MRLELDHMARAQQASARATEAAMASIKESLDAIKRTEASKSAPPDPVEGPQDRKAQKVWISDLPPTVSRPALNTSSTSYDTPEEQRFLRKKVASSTRLSAIPSVMSSHANPRERPGEPVGTRVSGYKRRSRLSSPNREG